MGKGLTITTQDYTSIRDKRIAIVTAEWNEGITMALRDGAVAILKANGWDDAHVELEYVPGAYELTTGSKWMAERADIDAVIAFGCVIQGETRHFDFICQAVATGLSQIALVSNKPVIFGVLTTDTYEQAEARAGGSVGHKGEEAAYTVLKMLALQDHLRKKRPETSIGFKR
jgi:6,7-dimethyl-8-ribityllumazine synthase